MERNEGSEAERMVAERLSTFRGDGDWQPDLQRGLQILGERRAASRERGRRGMFIVAGAAAVCLPIMALPATKALAARCVSTCVQETAVVREALLGHRVTPVPGKTWLKPEDRRMAPDFTLADADGHSVRLADMRGKVVLLNFWATWCKPCGEEIPWFVEFQKENQPRGFAAMGVSMDEGGWGAVRPFLEAMQINYPIVIGNDQVAALYGGLRALPLTLIIDREGRVAAVHQGLCRKDEYENDIGAALSER